MISGSGRRGGAPLFDKKKMPGSGTAIVGRVPAGLFGRPLQ
jgi:hypothetical protein